MSSEFDSNSPAANLLFSALKELKEMKIEVTVNIRPPGEPVAVPTLEGVFRHDITRTEELLPPVLTPKHIQASLGFHKRRSMNFSTLDSCMLLGPDECCMYHEQYLLNGWKGDPKTRR